MARDREHSVQQFEGKFGDLRAKLVETLGTDTVNLVLERAVREVATVYPGFRFDDKGQGGVLTWRPDEAGNESDDARAAYSALYAAMLVILARILGRAIAVQLASSVDAELVLQGQPIGYP